MRPTKRRMIVGPLVCAVVSLFLLAPIVIAVILSFTSDESLSFPPSGFSLRWYREIFTNSVWTTRIPVSVQVGLGTALLATVLGTMCAIAITRSSFPGKGLVTGLLLAPLVVPVVALATGEFFVMSGGWTIGGLNFGGGLVGTKTGLVLAHTVLALPYPTLLISTALRQVDPELELAAMSLGAGTISRFRRVTLPLVAPSVLAGAMFAFLTSWDEVVMASFLSSGRVSTVPVQILNELQFALNPTAAAISSLLMLVAVTLIALLTVARRLIRIRQRQAFSARPTIATPETVVLT